MGAAVHASLLWYDSADAKAKSKNRSHGRSMAQSCGLHSDALRVAIYPVCTKLGWTLGRLGAVVQSLQTLSDTVHTFGLAEAQQVTFVCIAAFTQSRFMMYLAIEDA